MQYFSKNSQKFFKIFDDFQKINRKFFVKFLKKIKILYSKYKSKIMCIQMDFQKNDFEKFLSCEFFGKKFQIAISQNCAIKKFGF